MHKFETERKPVYVNLGAVAGIEHSEVIHGGSLIIGDWRAWHVTMPPDEVNALVEEYEYKNKQRH